MDAIGFEWEPEPAPYRTAWCLMVREENGERLFECPDLTIDIDAAWRLREKEQA